MIPNIFGETALAVITDNDVYPNIKGEVYFQNIPGGTIVSIYCIGINGQKGPFGFHIENQNESCHYSDFPAMYSWDGACYLSFFTKQFTIDELIGKQVNIFEHPDDYSFHPSRSCGNKIAGGVIKKIY